MRYGSVRDDIKQSKPFPSLGAEAVVTLLRTADDLRFRVAEVLEPYGLSFQQYNVLRILQGAKSELPTLEIAARTIERSPGITRLLDRLEDKGLVHRERCKEDRRQVLCSITKRGREMVARLHEPIQRLDDRTVDVLSARELHQLVELLNRVRRRTSE